MRRFLVLVLVTLLAPATHESIGESSHQHEGLEASWEISRHDEDTQTFDVIARGSSAGSGKTSGFRSIAPGFALANLSMGDVTRLSRQTPDLDLQILSRARLMTDVALPIIGVPEIETQGLTGRGVFVGVVDSGFDVTHPAFRDPTTGKTRFEWLIDYSRRTRGAHADLEGVNGIPACLSRSGKEEGDPPKASDGGECIASERCGTTLCAITRGAIYSAADLDALLLAGASPSEPIPTDEQGHGTHAMSVIAGSRELNSKYRGVAPEAHLVGVKADVLGDSVSPASILQGVKFIFDRAAAANAPAVANLSLTADFVVRDGSDAFGPAIAELGRGPGRIIVAAAGNSGDPGAATHQTATTSPSGAAVRVTFSPDRQSTRVLIIASPRSAASDVRIGCDTASSTWVSPIERGRTRAGEIGDLVANVIFNPADFHGLLPAASTSALISMEGSALDPKEKYSVVLEGSGTTDLWIFGGTFTNGVREQTVGSPAMHPDVIAVGATVSRFGYRSHAGEDFKLEAAVYDGPGGLRLEEQSGEVTAGQVGAFSGAGPGPRGGVKPDLLAPGVVIVAAASRERTPGVSVFIGRSRCPRRVDGQISTDDQCTLVDDQHGMATGTSFAAPFVSGAAAILLEVDPTLRQEDVRAALQSGVHRHRSAPKFIESASVGELDVPRSVEVVRRLKGTPTSSGSSAKIFVRPIATESFITPNSHYVPADGTRPLEVLFHLRGENSEPADGFDINRFGSFITISDNAEQRREPRRLERVAPGLWSATFDIPPDRAPSALTIHATFDRAETAPPVTLPIALDPWQARYPSSASGPSCSFSSSSRTSTSTALNAATTIAKIIAGVLTAMLLRRLRRRRRRAQ